MSNQLEVAIKKRLVGVELDVRFEAGSEVLVLFGPSGVGKTTILNCIAGLVRPDQGTIALNARALFASNEVRVLVNVPPRKRQVGYVMQSYALFPHLTALQNVAYPVRKRSNSRDIAHEWLRQLSVDHLSDQLPSLLSGGQQQRVAIARALALQTPLLLLDEPFAALDGQMRDRLQRDLVAVQKQLGLIVVLVTHRLEDAFAMGDRIAVMREGQILQLAPVAEVFRRPATSDVAETLGIRNLFRAPILKAGNPTILDWNGFHVEVPPLADNVAAGTEVIAFIRPEDVKILYPDRPLTPSLAHNATEASVIDVRPGPNRRSVYFRLPNGTTIEAHLPLLSYSELPIALGVRARISLRREGFVVIGPSAIGAADRPINVQQYRESLHTDPSTEPIVELEQH